MTGHTKLQPSSGNVFQDLGFKQPDEWAAKAKVASHILRELEQRGLTQHAAARLLGISQPEVSNLKNGQLDRFSMERLFRFLGALDQRIEIRIAPRKPASPPTVITVTSRH